MNDTFIFDCVRSPRGRRKGSLSSVHPIDLAAAPLQAINTRNSFDFELVEDVIYGCVTQRAEQDNVIAREAVLAAGLPEGIPGFTVNRFCGSGLTACNLAAHQVLAGQAQAMIGGGVEHMTRCEMNIDFNMQGSQLATRYTDLPHQGISAEMIAEKYNFSRAQLDSFAAKSQTLADIAIQENRFERSLIPIEYLNDAGEKQALKKDEHPRPGTTVEKLAGLKAPFKENGVIHAGNSSGIVDGSAAILFGNENFAKETGLKPRARVLATADIGCDPIYMLLGPIDAIPKVCKKAGLKIEDIDLFEINEAFAPVALATIQDCHLDPEKVNVNGGAIALGHPLGATGAILLGTLVDELERSQKRYGVVTLCTGLGMAVAMLIERV